MINRQTLATLVVLAGIGVAVARGEEYYAEEYHEGVGGEQSVEEKKASENTAALFSEISEIRARGNSQTEVAENRDYRLVPTIRETAKSAKRTRSVSILGQLMALASCESEPARSYEWVDSFGAAANEFTESEFREALNSLPEINRQSLKIAIEANMLDSFKWRNAVMEIQQGEEFFDD